MKEMMTKKAVKKGKMVIKKVKEKRNRIKFSKIKSLRARNYLKKNNKKKVKKSLFLLRRKV
jgi:hypothetical protein